MRPFLGRPVGSLYINGEDQWVITPLYLGEITPIDPVYIDNYRLYPIGPITIDPNKPIPGHPSTPRHRGQPSHPKNPPKKRPRGLQVPSRCRDNSWQEVARSGDVGLRRAGWGNLEDPFIFGHL